MKKKLEDKYLSISEAKVPMQNLESLILTRQRGKRKNHGVMKNLGVLT